MRLTEADRQVFLHAVVQEGVDPATECPVCRSTKVTATAQPRYCDTHDEWQDSDVRVHCRSCRRVWVVVRKPQCCREAAA